MCRHEIGVGDVVGGVVQGEDLVFARIQSAHGEVPLAVGLNLLINVAAFAAAGVGDADDRDIGDGFAVFVHNIAFDGAALGAGDDFERGEPAGEREAGVADVFSVQNYFLHDEVAPEIAVGIRSDDHVVVARGGLQVE